MKINDFDKALEDMYKSIKKIGTRNIEDFFVENYPERWSTLTDKQKRSAIDKIRDFRDNPYNRPRIHKILKKLEYFKSSKFNLGILFLGVLLGISGNLVANSLDRYFVHYGFVYDFIVAVIFFFSFWYIDRTFIKKTSKEIMSDKTVTDILSILEEFEIK